MHVLHVIQRYYPFVGGSEQYFGEIGEQLVREGHRVTVLTTDAWDLDHFWQAGRRSIPEWESTVNGVRVLRFPVRRLPGPPIVYPVLRRGMLELGRVPGTTPLLNRLARLTPRAPGLERFFHSTRERFDLVHSTNITLDFTILPALRFAEQRGIPHLCTPFVHLGEPGSNYIVRYYSNRHQIALLNRSRLVVTQTGLESAFLAGRGVEAARLRLVGCWVRPETLAGGDGARFRQAYGIQAPIVLCLAGAAAYDKGTMHTIAAMQQLWRSGSDAVLVLMASTTLGQFDRFWQALSEADRRRIVLIRAAPHSVKLDALAAAELLVMPSRTDTFGIVYLEAWTYGLPVIGARAGGVPDVIADGQDGLLVRFGDVEALCAAIARLLDDRDLARSLGAAGRAKMLERFTFEQRFAAMRAVYQEALQGSGVRGQGSGGNA